LNHYDAIFKELWKISIDARERIKDIEEGRYINVEVLPNPKESIKWISEINKTAKEEILILLSSENGLVRTENIGGLDLLNKLAAKGIKIKIIIPTKVTNKINEIDHIKLKYKYIQFRNLPFSLQMIIGITIIDRIKSMIFEIKDDTKNNFQQALGLAIYVEGKSTALSYISIFNSLWKQTELYEQLKEAFIRLQIHEKMQKEFINTAAHELRTPLQPILGFSEHIRNKANDKEQIELLDIIIKNTKKLKKLSEDILDVSKIESNSFNLNKDRFALDLLILDIIKEFELKSYNDKRIEFEYHRYSNQEYILYGDRNRIGQVIFNLISNSIKFIPKDGKIIINIEKAKIISKEEIITVTIKDTGIGIDDEIYPNLFTKFATKSFQGTGLGLYISKNIIEAHGGSIWAEHNKDGKGATFGFRLPLKN
jgi:signal transduction histidine kinase